MKEYVKPEAKDLCLVIREAVAKMNDLGKGIDFEELDRDIMSNSDPITGGDF